MKLSLALIALALTSLSFSQVSGPNQNSLRVKVDAADLAPPASSAVQQPPLSSVTVNQKPAPNVPRLAQPLTHQTLRAAISSVVRVRGREVNTVIGYGLVTGLAGTGDSTETVKSFLSNELLNFGANFPAGTLSSNNIAIVMVDGELPVGANPGQRFDVRVSSIGDSTSLLGGNLVFCELFAPGYETAYATAVGPLAVGGYTASGEGATASKGHTTVGYMSGGAKVQRQVPVRIADEHGFIILDPRKGQSTEGNLVAVAEAINRLYPNAAQVEPSGSSVRVAIPNGIPPSQHTAYLASILKQEIDTDNRPRVIVNERTGVIVIAGDVRLRPGAIAHGAIVVNVANSPVASQPAALSGGNTEVLPRTELAVTEGSGTLIPIPAAVSLQEVVDVLNVLGASPQDLIGILMAMSDGGLLVAEIRRL